MSSLQKDTPEPETRVEDIEDKDLYSVQSGSIIETHG